MTKEKPEEPFYIGATQMQWSAMEKAALLAFDGREVAAEGFRKRAGYGGFGES